VPFARVENGDIQLKQWIWERIVDPILLRLRRRLAHYDTFESATHDGARWHGIATVGRAVVFYGDASVSNEAERDRLNIGDFCCIRGEILVCDNGAFTMGSHSFVGQGSRIWCRNSVTIGSHVLISHLVDVHDSDSHSFDWQERRDETVRRFEKKVNQPLSASVACAPVLIEDYAWIGFKSSILKGVTIGRGAIVAAGSVVTSDVPPFTLVAGNPARIVRHLTETSAQ
jgi:acetyltransferase-like isoleucine patch superfamily enzyme